MDSPDRRSSRPGLHDAALPQRSLRKAALARRARFACSRVAWNRGRLDFVARRDEGGPAADLDPNARGQSRLVDQAAVS